MPYNVDKDLGGDNKRNDKWMEDCVKGVMKENPKMPKGNAIAICKSQMKKNKSDSSYQITVRDINPPIK